MGKTARQGEVRLRELFVVMSEDLAKSGVDNEWQKFAIQRQLSRARKKARLNNPLLRNKAIDSFVELNNRLKDIKVTMDPFIEHNAKLFISEAFERFNRRRDPDMIQMPFDPRCISELWYLGPGASNGVTGSHTAEKLTQRWSCTPSANQIVQRVYMSNPYLSTCENGLKGGNFVHVSGSRMTTVEKNEDNHRTIAIEPLGNMAVQLAIGQYITLVLKSIGLDIETQAGKNNQLAWHGSLFDDVATIDMTSASDMFTTELVRRLLPKELFDTMLRIRSPVTELPNGDSIELNMMSTMGNGFTFPMMTLIFVSLVYAVRLRRGGPSRWIDWSKTGVFGDDIIVPRDEALELISVLEGVGFVINHDKSYLVGPFRESCGGDYYEGENVTPVYVKSLQTTPEIYVAINQVYEWSARMKVLLWRTIVYLKSLLDGPCLFVPEWFGDTAGFRTTQVEHRFKAFCPKPFLKRHDECHFSAMLATGGYIFSARASQMFYMPRPVNTRYKLRSYRLPRGFLDGGDPLSRSASVSAYIESYAFLLR